jgi:hypothetical protein
MYRILIVLSEWGYWGEELVAPLAVFDAKNCSDRPHSKGQARKPRTHDESKIQS